MSADQQAAHALRERVKELTLLHQVALLLDVSRGSESQLLQELVDMIPAAMQFPEVCVARIVSNGQQVSTRNWQDSPWRLSVPLAASNGAGLLEVAYAQKVWTGDEPFLPEERQLLTSVAELLQTHLEHRRTIALLTQREAECRTIFEHAGIGIATIDRDGYFIRCNPAILRLLGYSEQELQKMDCNDFIHQEDIAKDQPLFQSLLVGERGFYQIEKRYVRKDGEVVWGHLTLSVVDRHAGPGQVMAIAMLDDITGQKKAEEASRALEAQLRQSQRLQAVGTLAGGVAHDFNNMLGVILGYGQLLQERLPKDAAMQEAVGEIIQAAKRSAALTRQLLAFSRRQALQPQLLNLNDVVSDMSRMLRRLISANIELITHLDPDAGVASLDLSQIEQVIMNLVVNAGDAMPEGGKVIIETRRAELDEYFQTRVADGLPGSYVMLSVTDTGTGMDQATLAHIFDPFFTTKPEGKGTGLGLATVHGIVRQSGGFLWVYSEVGHGSTFKVYFPRVEAPKEAVRPADVPEQLGGTETILLAEDEVQVRQLVRLILESAGYRVLEADNGHRALEVAREFTGCIDLLVADMVMPHLAGPALAAAVRQHFPHLRALYISGYADEVHNQKINGTWHEAFLQKPFARADLLAKVRSVLR